MHRPTFDQTELRGFQPIDGEMTVGAEDSLSMMSRKGLIAIQGYNDTFANHPEWSAEPVDLEVFTKEVGANIRSYARRPLPSEEVHLRS